MVNKKSIVITSIGTFLEWYEFGIFGYLATYLAVDFLPKENELLSMIYVFGIFGLAYVTRPLGGFLFGILGDKYGRKRAIVLSSLMIALAMLFTSCLPTYKTIGFIATIFLIISRLIQGVSVGGEYSGTLVSLVEQADESKKKHRGVIGAIGAVNANIGFFSSVFIITILSYFVDEKNMAAWGWRIPFFIGFIIGLIFFLLRTTIDETTLFKNVQSSELVKEHPVYRLFKYNLKNFFLAVIINVFIAVLYSAIFIFMPELGKMLKVSNAENTLIDFSLILFSVLLLVSGYFSDIYGRRKIINIFSLIMTVVAGIFILFDNSTLVWQILILSILLAFPVNAVNLVTTEIFPTQCRYIGMGTSFNLANIIGGFTPMLLMIGYRFFKDISFIYVIICVFSLMLFLTVVFWIRETAFDDLI